MIINLENGNIESNSGEVLITPRMAFESIKEKIKKTKYGISYLLEITDDKYPINAYLYFNSHNLIGYVDIGFCLPDDPKSWDEWSLAYELKKVEIYKQYLKNIGCEKEYYEWGHIVAGYDEKSGDSGIFIRYFSEEPVTYNPPHIKKEKNIFKKIGDFIKNIF